MLSSSTVRVWETLRGPNYARALERFPWYISCIHTRGVHWMGLRFQFPILWFLAYQYTPAYNVNSDWWKYILLIDGYKPLGTDMAKIYDLSQLHDDHIQFNLDLQRRQVA